jgi:transcriptional regulator with XRE-family HTH domain
MYMGNGASQTDADFAFTIASGRPRRKKEDTSFGPRLTAIRKARGLTQAQLAEAAGTTQRSISYYENDDGIPPASVVIALAKALKVSADELLGIKPPRLERVEEDTETKRLWKRRKNGTVPTGTFSHRQRLRARWSPARPNFHAAIELIRKAPHEVLASHRLTCHGGLSDPISPSAISNTRS